MVDVSVRFQIAGDAEVVLNLPTTQAVRLVEAIMHNVAEAMAAQARGGQQSPPGPQVQQNQHLQPSLQGSIGWGDTQLRGEPPPSGPTRRPLG
ncbi:MULTISPECIES: hypothetical protein [unclassified Frankia]|uniref:hypothetical protein n=1 Tax=unclassified Frankia TaxID=2632575 RepID=UPI001EF45C1D|nr:MULTISPECIES: hypothetical protein [unclassified Frankia]